MVFELQQAEQVLIVFFPVSCATFLLPEDVRGIFFPHIPLTMYEVCSIVLQGRCVHQTQLSGLVESKNHLEQDSANVMRKFINN